MMAPRKPADDPYRILGVLRGADLGQIKAAHRGLAKRFHPDGSTADEERFLAVQEAYQLLSDPVRRREWDRRHAPVPMRDGRPPSGRRARGSSSASGPRAEPSARATPSRTAPSRAARPQRPEGRRTTTWSAEHVPWWEEFRPRVGDDDGRTASQERPAAKPVARPGRGPGPLDGPAQPTSAAFDFDVFDRSSGAAWSMAARRHFRRGDAELPSRGAWRYRGTQVVTGAEARKVAAEEAARNARRTGRGATNGKRSGP